MVGDAFNIALGFMILIIGTWVLIFGGIGLMLARSFGQNAVLGFALGTILGPIGWLAIWLMARQRGANRPGGTFNEQFGESSGGEIQPSTNEDDPWADAGLDDPLNADDGGSSRGF